MVHVSSVADNNDAHRAVAVAEEDWGLQACVEPGKEKNATGEDQILVNEVGSFAVASAAYWWGRLAAMAERGVHYILGPNPALVLLILLFADDWKITARGRMFAENILMALLFLQVCCFPLKWSWTHGGLMFDYIGYWMGYATFSLGISYRRAPWLMDWAAHLIAQQQVDIQELREVLGLFNFAAQVLEYDNPSWGRYTPGPPLCPLGRARCRSLQCCLSFSLSSRAVYDVEELCPLWITALIKESSPRQMRARHHLKMWKLGVGLAAIVPILNAAGGSRFGSPENPPRGPLRRRITINGSLQAS